jgi:hypothetical protein
MKTHIDKTQKNKEALASNEKNAKVQNSNELTFNLVDNRPENITQMKLKETVNNSPQVNKVAQLQQMADNYLSQQPSPIQKKNNTGLPDNLKTGMENLSGLSLDDVKVHRNSNKPAQLQAHAYAQGTNIHLGAGQEKHLPHEAWHVVQQKQGRVKPTIQMKGKVNVNDDSILEKEADIMGVKALSTVQKKDTDPLDFKNDNISDEPTQVIVQRAALDVDTILKDLPQILEGNSLLPEQKELKLETILYGDKTLAGRIQEIVSTYEAQFQKDESPIAVSHNAQKVLAAFHTIGMVIARKLHMGQEGHIIAKALLMTQKDRLINELKQNTSKTEISNALSDSDAKDTLKMAEVLTGDDPVGMYAQDKTSLEKADYSIRAMATQLNKTPIQIFELLNQQFESRIGSLSMKDVQAGELDDEGTEFPLKDLYGEVSVNFFSNLLDSDEQGKAKWGEGGFAKKVDPVSWTGKKRTFQLNDLNNLRDAVNKPKNDVEVFRISEQTQRDKGWEQLNNPQMEYLSNVETKEGGEEAAAKERIIKHFTDEGNERAVAIEKMNAGVQNLMNWPITLTTKSQDMLKADNSVVDTYKPFFSIFQKEERIDKYLPALHADSTVKIIEDVLGRGLDYGQERKEKDGQQIGFNSPISLTDMPAMACINYAYTKSKGPNYYGDTHFLLRPEVRKRSVFTYGTSCPERKSFFLVLNDMLSADKGGNMNKICEGDYGLQDIEVHIYGNIDLRRDIAAFHLGDPNVLEEADTRSAQNGLGSRMIPGDSPTEKLMTIKTMFPESFEDLKNIWIKKQKGTEELKALILSLPEDVGSNLDVLGDGQEINELELAKEVPTNINNGKNIKKTQKPKEVKGKGPCYITTACVKARGLADDCEELETLRYFRDEYMLPLPSGMDLVMFYYEQSPKIVDAINQDSESEAIYENLYQVILKCVKAIHEKQNQEAFATYVKMVLSLRNQYTPDITMPESLMTNIMNSPQNPVIPA